MNNNQENKKEVSGGGANRRRFLQTIAGGVGASSIAQSTSASDYTGGVKQSTADEDWPMFGYDTANTGHVSGQTGPSDLQERWRYETNYDIQASPVVSNGIVYIGSEDRQFYAIDIETGELIWIFEVEEPIEGAAAILQNKVFIPTVQDKVYALDKNTGEEIWSKNTDRFIRSDIVATDERLFYTIPNGLVARDVNNGEQQWTVSAYDSGRISPALADGSVYFGTTEPALYSIDAKTGDKEWVFRPYDRVASAPSVRNGIVYISSTDEYVYALDVETGEEVWSYELERETNQTSLSVADDTIYILTSQTLTALDIDNRTERWAVPLSFPRGSPAVTDKRVYVSANNSLHAFDKSSGKEVSSFQTGDSIEASPAIASNAVFVGSTDNSLYALSDGDISVTISNFNITIENIEQEVTVGEQINVDVSINNTGDATGTQDVVFEVNEEQKEAINDLELEGGESFTDSFTYEPVEADVPELSLSILTDDDQADVNVSILEDPSFKVEIDNVSDEVSVGETIELNSTITNTGDATGTQDVVFEVGGEQADVIGDLELDAGESFNPTFSFEPSDQADSVITAAVLTDDDEVSTGITVLEDGEEEENSGSVTENDTNADEPGGNETDGDDMLDEIPGFGVGGTVTALGGAAYLLKQRLTDTDKES